MKKLLESIDRLNECPPDAPMAAMSNPGNPVTISVNFNASGKENVEDLLGMIKNAGLAPMGPAPAPRLPMRQDMDRLRAIVGEPEMEADAAYSEVVADDEDLEEWDNEPEPEYQDHKYMTKDLAGGLNREKRAYRAAQDGDNAMAVEDEDEMRESIKKALMKSLTEKKAAKDFDGDGKIEKSSDEWKGSRDKAIKKAVAGKKKSPVKEVSSKTRQSYTKAANDSLDKALASKDKKTVKKRDRGLDLAYDKKIKDLKKKESVKEGAAPYAPVYLQHLKQQFGDKKVLDRSDKYKIADIIKKSSIEHLKQLALANIPHVSNAAKNYIKHKTPGGMVRPIESIGEAGGNMKQVLEQLEQLVEDADRLVSQLPLEEEVKDQLGNQLFKYWTSIQRAVDMPVPDDDELYKEAEFQAPTHELSDLARKATSIAQKIKRKINSGEQMDDRDYNQMAELGAILSRFGTSFGPKSMKDVMAHMVQYTDDRNQEGHGYPEFNPDRFKELIAMAK